MADKQIYIRPRRGTKTVMHETEKAVLVLKEGEVFFEFPDEGVGKGPAKVKIGDGISAYVALPYALGDAIETETVDFLEDHRDDWDTVYNDFKTGKTVQILVPVIKQLINLLKFGIDNIEASLSDDYYKKSETWSRSEAYSKEETYSKIETNDKFYSKELTYSKEEIDDGFYKKIDVYTKAEIDEFLRNIYWKSEVYNKSEVDALVRIPIVSQDPANQVAGDRWVLDDQNQ
jgi:hypothetical protein